MVMPGSILMGLAHAVWQHVKPTQLVCCVEGVENPQSDYESHPTAKLTKFLMVLVFSRMTNLLGLLLVSVTKKSEASFSCTCITDYWDRRGPKS